MNECIDKKLGNRLYAYEIDLLSDSEREEFEIHLLECKYCNEKARKFASEAEIIRNDSLFREIITGPDTKAASTKKFKTGYIKSILAIAAILVILILRPWQIEFHPGQEAVALENRLVILDFENMADSEDDHRTGEIIAELLITDLSQSNYIQVITHQRINDIIKQLKLGNKTGFSDDERSRIADVARASWILTGKILQADPGLALVAQLINVTDGSIAGSYRLTAEPEENLFSFVDRLSREIKKGLTLPIAAFEENDIPVADVTTHSREALLHYIEARDFYQKFYFDEATRSFEMALKYDTAFAMAYYYLAVLKKSEAKELIASAVKYSSKINTVEQLYIKSLQASIANDDNLSAEYLRKIIESNPDEKTAMYLLGLHERLSGRIQNAIDLNQKVIEIDPFNEQALNELTYIYSAAGNFQMAMKYIERYIELAPEDANPYDSKGDLLAKFGKLNEAVEAYKKSLSIKPDFSNYHTLLKLGRIYIFSGSYDHAHECFQEVIVKGERQVRSQARTLMAAIPLYQGKLNEALKVLDDGIMVDQMELATAGDNGNESFKHYMKGRILAARGEFKSAAAEMQEAIRVHNTVYSSDRPAFRCILAEVLAQGGDFEGAQKIKDVLEKEFLAGTKPAKSAYWYASGSIDMVKGNYIDAVDAMQITVAANPYFDFKNLLARAYLKAGDYTNAINCFELLIEDYSDIFRLFYGIEAVKMHYYLGVAYENSGRIDKAADSYKKLLNIWKDADSGLSEIAAARERLDIIQNRP